MSLLSSKSKLSNPLLTSMSVRSESPSSSSIKRKASSDSQAQKSVPSKQTVPSMSVKSGSLLLGRYPLLSSSSRASKEDGTVKGSLASGLLSSGLSLESSLRENKLLSSPSSGSSLQNSLLGTSRSSTKLSGTSSAPAGGKATTRLSQPRSEPSRRAPSLLGKHQIERVADSCKSAKKTRSHPSHWEEANDVPIDPDMSTCKLPDYNFSHDLPKVESVQPQLSTFDGLDGIELGPAKAGQNEYATEVKQQFINAVSVSLIGGPDFHQRGDAIRKNIIRDADDIIYEDPEFILKVALYTRKELNIRTTANFLLALAAMTPDCRPFLRKYFRASVALPSDWIDVAELYQTFHDKNINYGSLPSALRKAMVECFPKFDQYQLAKYNKEKKKKEPPPKELAVPPDAAKKAQREKSGSDSEEDSSDSDNSDTDEEEVERLNFTLKQLIRKLHIKEPVDSIMALLGKKYPEDLESFYQSHLPGTWDPERAGKRMKLPTPETWETQVSLKGNKAHVWEQLIDNKKLPFMAMLRNLRNMIQAGVSEKHHKWVLFKLTDHGSVVNSKQFPFRFFSAYEVLKSLERDLDKAAELKNQDHNVQKPRRCGKKEIPKWKQKKLEKKLSELPYDVNLLNRYRKALDTAVKIATRYNVKPIPGKTLLLCKCDISMDKPCTSARGLGKKCTVLDVGVLLGLMCKYSCEDCTMVLFDGEHRSTMDLESGTILENMDSVLSRAQSMRHERDMGNKGRVNPAILTEILRDRKEFDNLVILGDKRSRETEVVDEFLRKYRHVVNKNLLYVNVNLSGVKCGMSTSVYPKDANDIYIAGYSDQILRFIAERGDTGQVTHVENIDKAYNLTHIKIKPGEKTAVVIRELPTVMPADLTRKHHTLRVFISSTFRDMHGERDLLTRFVFPELRAKARARFVNLYEVDLRWGVNEEQTKHNSSVEICLREANRCDLFLGILGNRYGYIPDAYADLSDDPNFDWLSTHPRGCSITELEMYHIALRHTEPDGKAFFYIRDADFIQDLPGKLRNEFMDDDSLKKEKLADLKSTITTSGCEVFNGYPCKFGGIVEGKAVVVNLEEFGRRVINNVWNYIQHTYPEDGEFLDEVAHERAQHDMFLQSQLATFTGRASQMKQSMESIQKTASGIILISGRQGCGKTALMASIADAVQKKFSKSTILVHFVGAVPRSSHVVPLLKRLSNELLRLCVLRQDVPEEYKNLASEFPHLLEEAATCFNSGNKLIIFIDGISNLDPAHQAHNLNWLPENLPQNVVFVLSAVSNTPAYQAAARRQPTAVELGPLDLLDKAEVVRKTLAVHHKTLDESPFNNQMKLLVSKREANLPLFLKLACEELRVFGVFEEVSARLKAMSHTIASLLQEVLKRLEDDHGQDLISTALALLVLAREGLYEEDLHCLLSIHSRLSGTKYTYPAVRDTTLGPGALLPQALMARLFRGIRSLLAPIGEHGDRRLKVSHGQISQAIVQRYMKGAATELLLRTHSLLAGFFTQLAQPEGSGSQWSAAHAYALRELPYHLVQAGLFRDLQTMVTDLFFIQAKCQARLAPSLLEDFQAETTTNSKAILRDRDKFLSNPLVGSLHSFISRQLHILNVCPLLLWQQAVNEPDASLVRHAVLECGGCDRTGIVAWKNKKETANECSMTLTGFTEAVQCVAIAPGDRCFAVGTKDCQLKLYDMATGKELKSFTGHSDAVTSCCFVGHSRLVSASRDNTLSLWDVDQGFRVTIMKGHKRLVSGCISDPKGVNVASCGWDCRVLVWDGRSGKQTADITEARPISCLSYHPEGKLLVTGSWDSTLKIWDTFNKKRVGILRGHRSSVRAVNYSPSGRHIASASLDGAVKLWSADTGTQVGSLCGHSQPINNITYSRNGRELVTVSNDRKIKVWSGHLGKQLATFPGRGEKNAATQSIFSNDGTYVAMGYHSGEVKVMEVGRSRQEVFCYHHRESRVRGLAWTSGSKERQGLLIGYESGHAVFVFSVLSEKPLTIELKPCHSAVTTVAFSWRGKVAAVCYENMSIALWQNPKLNSSDKRSSSSASQLEPTAVLHPKCNGVITCCAFNTPGTKLVVGTRDAMLFVYSTEGQKSKKLAQLLQLDNCHKDWINSCAWSRHTDIVATGSNDSTIKLWDMNKEGKVKAHLKGHQAAIYAVAITEGCVVSGSLDGSVKVWTHRGVEITTLYGHSMKVNQVDIYVPEVKSNECGDASDLDDEGDVGKVAPGGNWAAMAAMEEWTEHHEKKRLVKEPHIQMEELVIVSASEDGTAQLWKPLQGKELATLTGHSDRVLSVAVGGSGQLVTTSMDQTVKLWNAQLSQDSVQLGAHGAEVVAVALSIKTSYAITTSRNGTVCLWKLGDSNKDAKSLDLLCSWKLPESTANAVCFIGNHLSFVLGLDNGTVSRWKIQERKGMPGKYITMEVKKQSINAKVYGDMVSPVTCMLYDEVQDALYVGTWVSLVTLQNLMTGKTRQTEKELPDWVLDLALTKDGSVVASLADGTVFSSKQQHGKGLIYESAAKALNAIPAWQNILTTAPQQTSDAGDSQFLVGNSCGSVMQLDEKQHHESRMLLSEAVTGLEVTQQHVVSACMDGTVKFWDKHSFKQVGQFFCSSPVTAMSALSGSSNTVLCGDQMGYLYLLEWRQ